MAKRKSKKNKSVKTDIEKIFIALGLILFLVVLAGVLASRLITHPKPAAPPLVKPAVPEQIPQKPEVKPRAADTVENLPYEIFPMDEPPPKLKPVPEALPDKLPLVAIIIDDLGYNEKIADKFLRLDTALSVSLFPQSPYGRKIAQKAHAMGLDVLLHLPMEPNEYPKVNPGPGTLFTWMTPDQLIDQLSKNINDIPHLKGVNNHMGSKMTSNESQMNQIFTILKKKGLFFIDSRTTTETLGRQSARLLQVPFAKRDVFLDHEPNAQFIRKQIKLLISVAYDQGYAIGIGHPNHITYKVLKEVLADLKTKVRLVPASQLVKPVG